jgi:glc operon protein GlcG
MPGRPQRELALRPGYWDRMRNLILAAVLFAAAPASGHAQAVLSQLQAQRIIEGCVEHAKAKRQGHAIAVVDAGAQPIAFLRMDGNAPGIGEFATAKAVAVAKWGFSTAEMATAARNTPGFDRAPHVVTVAGGVPIRSADGATFLGAVGVSGEAPEDDAACAEAGVKAAGLKTSSK